MKKMAIVAGVVLAVFMVVLVLGAWLANRMWKTGMVGNAIPVSAGTVAGEFASREWAAAEPQQGW